MGVRERRAGRTAYLGDDERGLALASGRDGNGSRSRSSRRGRLGRTLPTDSDNGSRNLDNRRDTGCTRATAVDPPPRVRTNRYPARLGPDNRQPPASVCPVLDR